MGGCVTRERAVAHALFSLHGREIVPSLAIHEAAPTSRGLTLWLRANCPGYVASGYFPDAPFGKLVGGLRNEDLEHQTFDDEVFDVVIHLDVLEHLFDPFRALREVIRTLKPGGRCIFTAPTEREVVKSRQVAFRSPEGDVRIVGEPEYHGDPQHPDKGVLVTWRYGYDLPVLVARETGANVEVRRWQSPGLAVMGHMTEVYILTRPSLAQVTWPDPAPA